MTKEHIRSKAMKCKRCSSPEHYDCSGVKSAPVSWFPDYRGSVGYHKAMKGAEEYFWKKVYEYKKSIEG
tara:strand:+ start:311 stop:517 length:207 start_codon:yes stop_codon:yes gene_type:complete